MSTVWEIVRAGSSLPSGTFWELLNSQEGGGSGSGATIVDSLEISVAPQSISVVLSGLEVAVETPAINVTVTNPSISAVLDNLEVAIDE